MTEKRDWDTLVKLEPRLQDLLDEALAYNEQSASENWACANWFMGPVGVGNKMDTLVGWFAEKDIPELKTSQAWDVVHEKIYDALPACRNCACIAIEEYVLGARL